MTNARGPIHIVGVGTWGHDVAERVAARTTTTSLVSMIGLDSSPGELTWPPAGLRVLASGRAVPCLAHAFDRSAYETATPWLAVVLVHPYLQIGPAVAPGRGACYGCWQRRLRQHAPAPELDSALQRHYEQHPTEQPAAAAGPSTELASAMALRVADRLISDPDIDGGWLRQVNLVNLHMTKGRGVGIHGCERCGLGRSEAGRSHERLSVAMGQALRWVS